MTAGHRIAFVYGQYPPNPPGRGDGGSDFLQRLAETLVLGGHDVTAIVSRREDRASKYVSEGGVRIAPIIEDWTLMGAVRERALVRATLEDDRTELVHLIYPDPYLRYRTDSYHLPFLLKRIARRPLVTTLFGFAVTDAHLVTKVGLLSLFATSDRLVITDGNLLARFQSSLPWWRGKARGGLVGGIASGRPWAQAELPERKTGVGLNPAQRHVGFFGFWTPDKGLENLLDAVGLLQRNRPDVALVLIGGGDRRPDERNDYERSIMQRARAAAAIDTGPLSEQQVSDYMLAMDVCALPFKVNPLGRSSLALALTLGVPTVVSRPPQDADLLQGCVLLDSLEPAAISDAIAGLLDDAEAQRAAAAAAQSASRHWSWDAIADDYVAIYDELLPR